MIETKQAIKLATAVASWSDEEREQILAMADALKAAASTAAPAKKRKYNKKKVEAAPAAEGEVKPKRKYTRKAKVAETATQVDHVAPAPEEPETLKSFAGVQ